VDLAAAANGGTVLRYSDAHYGEPKNLLRPGRGINMGDGWETARKKNRPAVLTVNTKDGLLAVPGSDWVVLSLGHLGDIERIEVDTHHFKGNFPESCFIEGGQATSPAEALDNHSIKWRPVLPRTKLRADAQHYFERGSIVTGPPVNVIRLTMYPDGGISRLRIWGRKAPLRGKL
jgi:allantoicase